MRVVGALAAVFVTDTSLAFICLTVNGTNKKQLALVVALKTRGTESVLVITIIF
jgi:hypothetical protein